VFQKNLLHLFLGYSALHLEYVCATEHGTISQVTVQVIFIIVRVSHLKKRVWYHNQCDTIFMDFILIIRFLVL
jgi:hypothetical protein